MKLYFSPPSPFSRKVRIVAELVGSRLDLVVADTIDPADILRSKNPLGKIPALELASGAVIYDSAVIVAYLDEVAQGGLIPKGLDERYAALTLEALADGLMDACVLQIYETRFRAENERSANWVAHQKGKVERALAQLEAAPPAGPVNIGHVALACALGYLDLRFAGEWRKSYPRLVAWLDAFAAKVPAFAATAA
jgi:glutathione S-transferase